jgi:hypothetical protein
MAALFGTLAFVAALFVVGAIMEGNVRKAGLFACAVAVCGVLILASPSRHYVGKSAQNCSIEWDGRANSEVCD